jgi:hypothetical protein
MSQSQAPLPSETEAPPPVPAAAGAMPSSLASPILQARAAMLAALLLALQSSVTFT